MSFFKISVNLKLTSQLVEWSDFNRSKLVDDDASTKNSCVTISRSEKKMHPKPLFVVALGALALVGCTTIDYPRYECGKVWGKERYLSGQVFDEKYFTAAKKGYIYAIAGALTLQKDNKEGNQHFYPSVDRLKEIERLHRKDEKTGFEVRTFELRQSAESQEVSEIVIAFAGSNDLKDWLQNFSPFKSRQYDQAVDYVKEIKSMPEYESIPLTLSGFSLGGALAVHVTKNPKTSSLVNEAWVFNPSPKIYAEGNTNNKIWLVAQSGEMLSLARRAPFRILPGVSSIGAIEKQTVDNYNLMKTNLIYGHFRWVLPVQMLHTADLAMKESVSDAGTTEPLEILKRTNFAGAKPCPAKR